MTPGGDETAGPASKFFVRNRWSTCHPCQAGSRRGRHHAGHGTRGRRRAGVPSPRRAGRAGVSSPASGRRFEPVSGRVGTRRPPVHNGGPPNDALGPCADDRCAGVARRSGGRPVSGRRDPGGHAMKPFPDPSCAAATLGPTPDCRTGPVASCAGRHPCAVVPHRPRAAHQLPDCPGAQRDLHGSPARPWSPRRGGSSPKGAPTHDTSRAVGDRALVVQSGEAMAVVKMASMAGPDDHVVQQAKGCEVAAGFSAGTRTAPVGVRAVRGPFHHAGERFWVRTSDLFVPATFTPSVASQRPDRATTFGRLVGGTRLRSGSLVSGP